MPAFPPAGEAEARVRLEMMTAAASDPALTAAEVTDLLLQARRADAAGLGPNDTGWVPTWSFASGAAAGWRMKAAKVVAEYDFASDGQRHDRSQVFDMCMQMAARHSRGAVGSIPIVRASLAT